MTARSKRGGAIEIYDDRFYALNVTETRVFEIPYQFAKQYHLSSV